MRILYLSPWFPYPLDTGSRTRVYFLLRALAQNHRITLLSLDPHGCALAEVEVLAPFCERAAVIPKDPFRRNRMRMATRFFSLRPVVANPFPEMLHYVHELHAATSFDLIIAGTVVMAAYTLALSGAPRILEEHNCGSRWMAERYQAQTEPLQQLRCWVSWRKARLYESKLFQHFDLVSMVSAQDAAAARALIRNGKPPVVVFPNGVDCQQLRPGLASPRSDTLIFSGALTYHANFEAMQFFLSQVYPRIQARHSGVRLRITGANNGIDRNSLRLDDSVTLIGFVDDVHTEIASATIAVVPILSGGGTRLKILEAMALGTPVISTTKGAEGIDAVHGQHLLLADDPASFAEHTLMLLQDAPLRQHLAANARKLVEERYDWAQIGQDFARMVEQVAERSGA